MIITVINEFRPEAQSELFQFRNFRFILDILEVEVLCETDFVHFALIGSVAVEWSGPLVVLCNQTSETGLGWGLGEVCFRHEDRLPVVHIDAVD